MTTREIIRLRFTPSITSAAHGSWMAVCNEFRQAASGETEAEARRRLRQIIESFASALNKLGMLDKAIAESGIKAERITVDADEDVVLVYEQENA